MPDTKKRWIQTIGIIAALLLIGAGIWYAIYSSHYVTTDDAFVDAHIIPVSPKVSGQVSAVLVNDNQKVEAGQKLIEIDPRDYVAKLREERANLAAAEAEARRAAGDVKRYEKLIEQNEISRQQLDNAQAASALAQAKVESERAAVQQDELNLSYAQITAPEAGRITKKSVEPGAYVQVGQTLFSIVPDEIWVTANFKETQLTHMRPGQSVQIKADAFPDHVFEGHVDSIQAGTGERFSVMPPENATGNYVKVVQRVPVKIVIDTPMDPHLRLAPGMSVEPRVRIR